MYAYRVRNEWIDAEGRLARKHVRLSDRDSALLARLRFDAIYAHPVPPPLPLDGLTIFDLD